MTRFREKLSQFVTRENCPKYIVQKKTRGPGDKHRSLQLALTAPSGSRVVRSFSSGLQEREVAVSSLILIEGTYSLLEPE